MKPLPYNRPGVYRIRNLVTGTVYVGSAAKSLRTRTMHHVQMLDGDRHPNIYLQRAWNLYGADCFEVRVVWVGVAEKCLGMEEEFLQRARAKGRVYNLCPVAGSRLGCKLSDEAKAKISAAKKGKKLSAETRAKMSESQLRKPPVGQEARQKLRRNHWSKGPKAVEIAARIAASNKGKAFTEDRKRNISAGRRRQLGIS